MKERTTDKYWFPWWPDKWIFGSIRIECTLVERGIWVDLLSLASKDSGHIRANEDTPYPIQQLSGMLIIPEDILKKAIDKFVKNKKLTRMKNNTLYVTKWEKYQFCERHKRRVEKEMSENPDTIAGKNDPIIYNSTIEDNIEEDNIEEGKNLTPTERKILNELKKVKNYPYKLTDTVEYIRELTVDFPGIDILDEIQKKVAWWRDNPLTKKSNPHLQLRNWLKNAIKFNNERRGIDMVGGQSDNDKVMAHYEKQKAAGMFDDLDGEDY